MKQMFQKSFGKLPRITEMTDIDDLICSPNTTLRNLLFTDVIINPKQIDPRLMDYYLSHYDEVVSYVLLTRSVEKHFQLAATRLFFSNLELFIEKTMALKIFYDYAFNLDQFSELSYSAYFSVINNIIFLSPDSNSRLRNEFKTPDYFEVLFGRLDITQNFLFLYTLIKKENYDIKCILFNSKELFDIILDSILSDVSKISERGRLLFISLIKSISIYDPADQLLKDNIIDKIVNHILANPSNNGFLFLRELYIYSRNSIVQFLTYLPDRSKKWKKVNEIITSYSAQFSSFLDQADVFDDTTLGCAKLYFAIIYQAGDMTDISFKILNKLWNMFFEFPTNSFLHQFVSQTFLQLKNKKILTLAIIEKLDMVNIIIEKYKSRLNIINAAYWGHLIMISNIINTFKINNKEWNEIVIKENQRREKIMKKPYGGQIVKTQEVPLTLYFLLVLIVILIILIGFLAFQ